MVGSIYRKSFRRCGNGSLHVDDKMALFILPVQKENVFAGVIAKVGTPSEYIQAPKFSDFLLTYF